MEAIPEDKLAYQVSLPSVLEEKLRVFRKILWRIKILEALSIGLCGIFFSFLCVLLFERFTELDSWLRLLILLGGFNLVFVFSPYWIYRWVIKRRNHLQLAHLISRKFPGIGDRLLGAVELHKNRKNTQVSSIQLHSAAINSVAHDVGTTNLLEALPNSYHRRWLFLLILLGSISALITISYPRVAFNALVRWISPFEKIQRYTFTKLDLAGMNSPLYVPYGESSELKIPLADTSLRNPPKAYLQLNPGSWLETPSQNRVYHFMLPAQRSPKKLILKADDFKSSLPIKPVMRPNVEKVQARISPPEYLLSSDFVRDLRSGSLSVLEGSTVLVEAEISRPLKSVICKREVQKNQYREVPPLTKKPPSSEQLTFLIDGKKITSYPIAINNQSLQLSIQWQDIFFLRSKAPLRLSIESRPDMAPSTYILGLEEDHYMLVGETVQLQVFGEDDYGIKTAGLYWKGENTALTLESPTEGEIILKKGNPNLTNLKKEFFFSPLDNSIKPQKIILQSWVEDYFPERKRTYSQPINIYVLTAEEHIQIIKEKFQKSIDELENIFRKEQYYNDENLRIEKKFKKNLNGKTARNHLREQIQLESDNIKSTQKLLEGFQKLFKNALRNQKIKAQTMSKITDTIQSIEEILSENLPEVQRQLMEAVGKNNALERSQKKLRQAIETQQEAIAKIKQTLKNANEVNELLEAGTFVNRLRQAAFMQEGIIASLVGSLDSIVGQDLHDLDPADHRNIKKLHLQHDKISNEVRWIQEDLSHYFNRTRKPKHQKLKNTMQSSKINEALEMLSTDLRKNLAYKYISEAKFWASLLRKWSEQIDGSNNKSVGKGSGARGHQNDGGDFEFMLKVMRLVQKEQEIRNRTRALDELKRSLYEAELETTE